MARLSITAAWNEASTFVRREAHLLFPIAFLLGSLPGAALQILLPQSQPAPGQAPEPGLWLIALALASIVGFVASVAMSFLALRPGASVGDALGRGLRRLPSLLGAMLLLGLGLGLLMMIFLVIGSLVMPEGAASLGSGAPPNAEALALIGLVILLAAPFLIFFATRFALVTPAAAGEEGGPIAILGRSWRLTAGYFWKIFGFLLLLMLGYFAAAFAIQFVLGSLLALAAGPPEPGNLTFVLLVLVEAVIGAVFSMFLVVTLAEIYRQLSGGDVAEVFR